MMEANFTQLLRIGILLLCWVSHAYAGVLNFEVKLEDVAPGEIQAIYQDKKALCGSVAAMPCCATTPMNFKPYMPSKRMQAR